MTSRATVRSPGTPDREIALPPGVSAEPLPSVRVTGAEVPGLVLEIPDRPVRIDGRRPPRGERRLLRPGQSAAVGVHRILAGWEDAGTATGARALLHAALRGALPDPGPDLHVLAGPAAGRRLPLRAGVLGRGALSAIRIDDPSVSRSHARIDVVDGCVTVRDLGSRNGLWLGEVRVVGPRTFTPGDELRVGRTVLALGIDPPPPAGRRPEGRPDRPRPWPARTALLAAAAATAAAALLLP